MHHGNSVALVNNQAVITVPPNHAFNRTRRYGPSTWRASVTAGRLTWSCQASHRGHRVDPLQRDLAHRVQWADLLQLRKRDVVHELLISIPWLIASLAAAASH